MWLQCEWQYVKSSYIYVDWTKQKNSSPNQFAVDKNDLFVETDGPYPIEWVILFLYFIYVVMGTLSISNV